MVSRARVGRKTLPQWAWDRGPETLSHCAVRRQAGSWLPVGAQRSRFGPPEYSVQGRGTSTAGGGRRNTQEHILLNAHHGREGLSRPVSIDLALAPHLLSERTVRRRSQKALRAVRSH